MSAQANAVLRVLELARDGGGGAAGALMLTDGSVMLEFPAQEGSVRIHADGRVDQVWRDGDGLHSQGGERPLEEEQNHGVAA